MCHWKNIEIRISTGRVVIQNNGEIETQQKIYRCCNFQLWWYTNIFKRIDFTFATTPSNLVWHLRQWKSERTIDTAFDRNVDSSCKFLVIKERNKAGRDILITEAQITDLQPNPTARLPTVIGIERGGGWYWKLRAQESRIDISRMISTDGLAQMKNGLPCTNLLIRSWKPSLHFIFILDHQYYILATRY